MVTLIQATREQIPLTIHGYPVVIEKLPVGDYGIRGLSDWTNPEFIIERKSLDDLVGSLGRDRERFMKEIHMLRRFKFAAIVVESDREDVVNSAYRSRMSPQSVLSSLNAIIVRSGVHLIWAGDPESAAREVENLVRQFVRGIEKQFKAVNP